MSSRPTGAIREDLSLKNAKQDVVKTEMGISRKPLLFSQDEMVLRDPKSRGVCWSLNNNGKEGTMWPVIASQPFD